MRSLITGAILVSLILSACDSADRRNEPSPIPERTQSIPMSPFAVSERATPDEVGALATVVCPVDEVCIAGGQTTQHRGVIIRTVDGGATWTIAQTTQDLISIDQLGCLTTQRCVAFGTLISGDEGSYLSEDGGATWTAHAVSNETRFENLSCVEAVTCYAIGEIGDLPAILESHDLRSWTELASPEPRRTDINFVDLSCTSRLKCWLGYFEVRDGFARGETKLSMTLDGGRSWTDLGLGSDFRQPLALDCIEGQGCWYGGFASLSYSKGSGDFIAVDFPTALIDIGAISCRPRSVPCFGIAYNGIVELTENGPRLLAQADGELGLRDIYCSEALCIAVGGGISDARIASISVK